MPGTVVANVKVDTQKVRQMIDEATSAKEVHEVINGLLVFMNSHWVAEEAWNAIPEIMERAEAIIEKTRFATDIVHPVLGD